MADPTAPIAILSPVFPKTEVHPALFLDRDDTLIPDLPYRSTPEGLELFPHAAEGLRLLRRNGYRLILVSNQSGIGRGRITREQLTAIHDRIQSLLRAEGVQLDAAYYCPHTPQDACTCRKPATGLLDAACAEFPTELTHSAMVGDKPADILLARSAHISAIQLMLPGRETIPEAAVQATNLLEAANWLLDSHRRPAENAR